MALVDRQLQPHGIRCLLDVRSKVEARTSDVYPAYWATSGTKRSQRMNRVARKGP
jgi:hypothetical protein